MTANKSSKAAPRAGGVKTPRDIPDRSVTAGKGWAHWCALPVMPNGYQSIYLAGSFCSFNLKEKQVLFFPLMGNYRQRLPVIIRHPNLLQVRSCILDKGPIQILTVSSELKLVLACWEPTVSCCERKTNIGNDMWYLDCSTLQSVILSIFIKSKTVSPEGIVSLVRKGFFLMSQTAVTLDNRTSWFWNVVCLHCQRYTSLAGWWLILN